MVLLDGYSTLLKGLGANDSFLLLCRQLTVHEEQALKQPLFIFETYELLKRNQKVDDLIATKDGVLVLVDYRNVTNQVVERIQHIKCRPLLVVVYNCPNRDCKHMIKSTNTENYRVNYIVDESKYHTEINNWFANNLGKFEQQQQRQQQQQRKLKSSEFMLQFQNGTLPLVQWNHYGRLRIVYLALKHYGYEDTCNPNGWLCANWKRYKESIGHGHLWNYTLTMFWVKQIHQVMHCDTPCPSGFRHLYDNHPDLHNGKLHEQYYSKALIFSDTARNNYVAPDLAT